MKFDTSDIDSWRKLAATIFPLLLPWLTAIAVILLKQESWPEAIAGAISGFTATMWGWINKSPMRPNGSRSVGPTPIPPPSKPEDHPVDDLPPSDRGPGGPCVFLVAIILALATPSIASAQITSSSTSSSGLMTLLHRLKCSHDQGVCPSIPMTFAAIGLDVQFHALEVGAGIGIDVPFTVSGIDLAAGLAVVPLLQLDHQVQQGVFSLLLHLDLYKGAGAGLLYKALEIGGPKPGLLAFQKQDLFAVLTLDFLQAL